MTPEDPEILVKDSRLTLLTLKKPSKLSLKIFIIFRKFKFREVAQAL